MIRVKAVIMVRMLGARLRIVIRITIFIVEVSGTDVFPGSALTDI
jgi:hypothetical protein